MEREMTHKIIYWGQQSYRGGVTKAYWNPNDHTMCHRCQEWSGRIWCFPCQVLGCFCCGGSGGCSFVFQGCCVLFWSVTVSCACFFHFGIGTLFILCHYSWECASCSLLWRSSHFRDIGVWKGLNSESRLFMLDWLFFIITWSLAYGDKKSLWERL